MLSSFSALAQKKINEVRLISPYLEYVSLDEIQDFQAYQQKHFKNPRGLYLSQNPRLLEAENLLFFRLKGSKDILRVFSVLNEQSINDWEGHVKTSSEMYSLEQEGSIEFVDLEEESTGAILHLKTPISLRDSFFYQNKTAGITLIFTYISNHDAETRADNMRKILQSLKVEDR